MTKPDARKVYIPHGADQQGRRETGVFVPADDQSQGLSFGETLYVYGGIVIGCVAFVSGVLWLCGVGR